MLSSSTTTNVLFVSTHTANATVLQVPDGPILANGDMGVGVGGIVGGNQSFYFGKM